MPLRVTTVDVRVRYAETDQMGVAYHSHYLVWCEIGRTDHIRQSGVAYRELEERGVALAVAEARVRYRSPARYDDLVRIATTLPRIGSRAMTFAYEITLVHSGLLLATADTVLVSLDRQMRVTALPGDVRELLQRTAHA